MIFKKLNLNYQIHLSASLDVSEWDHFLIFPSGPYVECRYGIFLLKELKIFKMTRLRTVILVASLRQNILTIQNYCRTNSAV